MKKNIFSRLLNSVRWQPSNSSSLNSVVVKDESRVVGRYDSFADALESIRLYVVLSEAERNFYR